LTDDSAQHLIQFLETAMAAWGRDAEYFRLWGSLNLGLCMWLWRRLVLDKERAGSKRYVILTVKQFNNCLMALSADAKYGDWLQGRQLTDRDRGPAYGRVKNIWSARLESEGQKKISFPKPPWATR
jgi:hypothetical protein